MRANVIENLYGNDIVEHDVQVLEAPPVFVQPVGGRVDRDRLFHFDAASIRQRLDMFSSEKSRDAVNAGSRTCAGDKHLSFSIHIAPASIRQGRASAS